MAAVSRERCEHDHTGLDEHVLALGDERVHRWIVDQIDVNAGGIDTAGSEQRILVAAQCALGLRVTQQQQALRRSGRGECRQTPEEADAARRA